LRFEAMEDRIVLWSKLKALKMQVMYIRFRKVVSQINGERKCLEMKY